MSTTSQNSDQSAAEVYKLINSSVLAAEPYSIISLRKNKPYFRAATLLLGHVMPFFLELQKHFIKYHMNDVRFLNKPLAWSLYEYLKEKFLGGKCPEWVVEVIDLKDRLGVTNKYTRFSNFDNLCLKRPQADINKYTDLKFEYKKIKKGRTVVKIKFIVIQKSLDPDVIDTEDLGKIFARELALAKIASPVAVRFVKAAADQNLTSAMLEKLPKIKKSWGKNGGKPYSAYLSGVLHKELLEMDLFETLEKEKKTMNALQGMPDATLQALANTGNIPAQKILGERKNKNG